MTNDDADQFAEGPASVMRLILEAQNELSPEQREYVEKMQAYFDGPGHDQAS